MHGFLTVVFWRFWTNGIDTPNDTKCIQMQHMQKKRLNQSSPRLATSRVTSDPEDTNGFSCGLGGLGFPAGIFRMCSKVSKRSRPSTWQTICRSGKQRQQILQGPEGLAATWCRNGFEDLARRFGFLPISPVVFGLNVCGCTKNTVLSRLLHHDVEGRWILDPSVHNATALILLS